MKCSRARMHAGTWISQVGCCISSLGEPPYSNLWHHYLLTHLSSPLNDFSSSDASHLIKVESLMPFRDPGALDRAHCHYGNEWRQLRTQMFSRVVTESLLMCLVISAAAASDWRPLVGDSANHVTRLAAQPSAPARCVPLSAPPPTHPPARRTLASRQHVLLIEIISARWKESWRKGGKYRVSWRLEAGGLFCVMAE